jgi:hypothetical protein
LFTILYPYHATHACSLHFTPRAFRRSFWSKTRVGENAHAGKRVGSDIDTKHVVGHMARQGDQTYYVRNNTIGVRQRSYMHSRPRGLRSDVSEARQPDPSDTETREARHPRGRRAVMLLTYPACLCKKQKSYMYLFRHKT